MASVFYAIRSFFRGDGAPEREVGQQNSYPFYSGTAAADVTFDTAMQVSAVWAAVRIVSETIASLPFDIYELNDDGTSQPAESLELRRILTKRPNQYQTSVEFWESVLLNLVISGNAYCIKQRLSSGKLGGLMPISSSQVKTNLLADGTVVHEYTEGANVRVFSQENMWHIKLYGNGIVGMSPLSYARNSVAVAQALDTRVNKIYSNGAKPSGILMIDRTLTAEQRAKIKENFNDLTEGQDDRLFVLEADMKYQQVSMSPQDIQLLDSRRFQIEDIGRFFGVPSVLLNQTVGQSSLGSNVYEIMQAFYKLNLRPYMEKIEASILRWLIDPKVADRYEPRFDFDALLRADTLSRAQAFREMINSGQITPNEARRAEGRGALPGGDTLLIQGAMIPIEKAGEEPEPPPMPAPPEPSPDDGGNDGGAEAMMRFEQIAARIEARMIKSDGVKPSNHHIDLKPHFTVNVHPGQAPEIKIDNNIPAQEPPIITNEVNVPEQKMPAPIVNVAAPEVTVVDNHPKRAVQTVERDDDDEITRTIIDYEKD